MATYNSDSDAPHDRIVAALHPAPRAVNVLADLRSELAELGRQQAHEFDLHRADWEGMAPADPEVSGGDRRSSLQSRIDQLENDIRRLSASAIPDE